MIIVKLQGGLGNQLFQWAVGKSLSIKYNTEFYFNTSYFQIPKGSIVSKWDMDISKIVDIKVNNDNSLKVINDDFYYKDIEDNSFLDGYWQSEKYFKDSNISELFINDHDKIQLLSRYPVLETNTVSIHVRRGDYLNLQDYHPVQTIDYYEKAYSLINDENINVIVLSNDIQWCKDNFKFKNMTFIENESNITDLRIMSLCKHNIIANSSFSWWGAWLNNNKDKKVIAPINWFGPQANLYTGDIIPEKWIKI